MHQRTRKFTAGVVQFNRDYPRRNPTASAVWRRSSGSGQSPTIDAIRDRLVATVAREAYVTLYPGDAFVASVPKFESAVAERVQHYRATH